MRVAVLGAGLQGVCVALELAWRGIDVTLIEQDSFPLNRASLRNEGKIHLGLVYSNDSTFDTARSMLQGALHFRNLLNRWIHGRFDKVHRSAPFWYLVAKDSLLTVSQLSDYYEHVQNIYEDYISQDRNLNYLGQRPERLSWSLTRKTIQNFFPTRFVDTGFGTEELAVDVRQLIVILRRVVAENSRIQFLPQHKVEHVFRCATGFVVEGRNRQEKWRIDCDQVFNALWDGRLAIDAKMNLLPKRSWIYRLKYRVMVHLASSLRLHPSVTYVIGAYGDIVILPRGVGYVSWYPECLRGWSTDLGPPTSWNAPCRGKLSNKRSASLAKQILDAADPWFPGLRDSTPFAVDAGVIFAWGNTDITDRESELHNRSRAGIISDDGYHTIDTGKLTLAPLFAREAANRVLNIQFDPACDF